MSLENLFNSLQNLFSGGQDQPQEKEKQSEGLMSSSLRPRARPEGVNVSLRPRARPTSVNIDDNNPVDYAAATINSINNPTTVNYFVSLLSKLYPKGNVNSHLKDATSIQDPVTALNNKANNISPRPTLLPPASTGVKLKTLSIASNGIFTLLLISDNCPILLSDNLGNLLDDSIFKWAASRSPK